MRISDWSSDVCSSDLQQAAAGGGPAPHRRVVDRAADLQPHPVRVDGVAFLRRDRVQRLDEDRVQLGPVAARRHRHLDQERDLAHHHDAGQGSEEQTSEIQPLMRISYAVFCLKTNKKNTKTNKTTLTTQI